MNKQFEGAAEPTAGTYRKGAIVWNTNLAPAQVMGWVCSAGGTMGALTDITATGTIGETTITVNATTGMYVGANIAIAGGIVATSIANIDGLTVTLNNALTGSVTDAAVSFYAATWRAMPAYS
jgi:hypothetical protein